MYLPLTLHGIQRQLPLVLCGPMLRKVTPDSVTVWVALHSACSIRLIVLNDVKVSIFESGDVATVQIGEHLHIACVTAKAKVPAEYLEWNKRYYYDLHFTINGIKSDLNYPQICGTTPQTYKDDFCYGEEYPSFVLPPGADNIEHLRLVHGSCRKPHGGGLDALSCVDTLIKDNFNNPLMRPQLLCMTGDQIYADEVDDSVISIIGEVAGKILQGQSSSTPYGDRSDLMKNIGFTSDECHNQLISFSEFVAMYLLVWSEELWPLDISTASDEVQKFRKRVPSVRRALANIPTYMVFDDHEITDDWNRLKKWREKTYFLNFRQGYNSASTDLHWVSHTIIANGLLAYALFQGWGNLGEDAPARPTYYNIFDVLNKQPPPCKDPVSLFNLQKWMLPITAANGNWTYLEYPNQEMPWSFRVTYPGFQLIGLDSRNLRGYRDGIHAPAVIYPGNIPPQLGNDYSKPLTIVMCGAPLFGLEAIEFLQGITDMKLISWKKYDDKYDKEAWSFDLEAFHTMQVELAKFKKIVVLSGDVHYGFSAKVAYWGEQANSLQTAVFVQCCSSALLNRNTKDNSKIMKIGRLLSRPAEKVWTKIPGQSENYLVSKKYYIDELESKNFNVHQQLRIALLNDKAVIAEMGSVLAPSNLFHPFKWYDKLEQKVRKIMNATLIADTNIGLIFFSGNTLNHRLITPMPNAPLSTNQTVATHIIDFQLPDPSDKPI